MAAVAPVRVLSRFALSGAWSPACVTVDALRAVFPPLPRSGASVPAGVGLRLGSSGEGVLDGSDALLPPERAAATAAASIALARLMSVTIADAWRSQRSRNAAAVAGMPDGVDMAQSIPIRGPVRKRQRGVIMRSPVPRSPALRSLLLRCGSTL